MDDMISAIGEAAGVVWKTLEQAGNWTTVTQLKKSTTLSADMVQRALGWLAREGNVRFQVSGSTVKVTLP